MINIGLSDGFKRGVMLCTAIILIYGYDVMATENINKPDNAKIAELKKLAESGDFSAQYELATYYQSKIRPTAEDTANMIYWYEIGAKNPIEKNGSTDAHWRLGSLYCGELCLPQIVVTDSEDRKEFVKQYNEEIERHHIKPNYVKAYLHFKLAEEPWKMNYNDKLRKLAANMTNEEIELAEQIAKQWMK